MGIGQPPARRAYAPEGAHGAGRFGAAIFVFWNLFSVIWFLDAGCRLRDAGGWILDAGFGTWHRAERIRHGARHKAKISG